LESRRVVVRPPRVVPAGRKGNRTCWVARARGEEQQQPPQSPPSPPPSQSSSEGKAKQKKVKQQQSSWTAPSKKKEGGDYLWELGQSDINLNIDTGQTSFFIDSNFAMNGTSDISRGDLRKFEFRKLDNIVGDYHIPAKFQEKLTLHIAKNFLVDQVADLPETPLILGIWGGKGEGKSFLTELCLKQLKVEPVVMSAGELEDEWAGTPARLIRERYRKASDLSRVRGKLSCIVINDIDAGLGNFAHTQNTVNTQMVVGTLMNLCDHPTRVSIGQDWMADDIIRRIPIIVTGNDFGTMYAPLLRDGRMEKFYWKPEPEDKLMMVYTMFKENGVPKEDIEKLMSAFPGHALDFFGALRSRLVDKSVIQRITQYSDGPRDYLKYLMNPKNGEKEVSELEIEVSLPRLLEEGYDLSKEQEHVKNIKLSEEYQKHIS